MANHLFDNLLVLLIMGSIILAIYCKMTKKTLTDVIREIREGLADE